MPSIPRNCSVVNIMWVKWLYFKHYDQFLKLIFRHFDNIQIQPALGNMTSVRPKSFLWIIIWKKKSFKELLCLNWKAGFCNFKPISLFFQQLLLWLHSLAWVYGGKSVVTELILYKTIIVSYRLHFLLSEYFTIKEIHPNTLFIFLCKA